MKKIILLIGLSILSLSNLQAQSLAGSKIFINPGHGGYDSNDREIPLAAGITFWESEGNLVKGLYLKTMLENLGATVIMSRVTNTSADDYQPTSQIAAMASANNVDYFHSIHSNATGTATKANYTLILFQGRTNAPTFNGSLTMANFMADNILQANRTTRKMVAGDFDFYGTGQPFLGVFIGLNMPGTLSEGSFHDYTPETWRLKNDSYLKHEAWAIARSFLQYFNGGSFQKGIIAGIVRDELETVPASYQPLIGTNDRYKPLNKIKVRLEPGGRTYTGDEFNNGYYFFDDVTPGNYKLYFDYEKMKTDSASIVVKANESVFADKLMILNPILDPPVITNSSPTDNTTEVSNITDIVIEFSIRMNVTETQNAIIISPVVDGSFKWDTEYKKVTFTPSKGYTPGTKYTVTISPAAKTHFGINLLQEKSFNFTTRSKLNLVSTYPLHNSSEISTSVLISVKFEKGIDGTSLGGRISLSDSDANTISVSVKKLGSTDGLIEFEPKVTLNNNSLYRITLKEGIRDIEYVLFPNQVVIEFRTEKSYNFTGNLLEGFEIVGVWQSPLSSSNTTGVVSSQTSFEISSSRIKSGQNGGKLDYGFSGMNGIVELALINPLSLGESSPAGFGFWVFGDNSKNILEYRFSRNNSNDENVKIDSINWTGWKLKKISLNEIPGSGAIKFKSINVVQSGLGNISGTIYFDECVGNIITGVINADNNLPLEFGLYQNYPNPFNPTTTINYSIPVVNEGKALFTTLKIYDLLGREIATLVDENKTPGTYEIKFNASGLASGIYIYQLHSGDYTASKKLILLK